MTLTWRKKNVGDTRHLTSGVWIRYPRKFVGLKINFSTIGLAMISILSLFRYQTDPISKRSNILQYINNFLSKYIHVPVHIKVYVRPCPCPSCAGSCEPGSWCRPNECIFGSGKPRGAGILEWGVYGKGREMGRSVYEQPGNEVDGSYHSKEGSK